MQVRKSADIIDDVVAGNTEVIAQAGDWLKADAFDVHHLSLLLYYASRRGYMNILKILVDNKLIDINTELFGMTTALMESVDTNQTHAAEFLLKAGATQAPNAQGQYPIEMAIAIHNEKMAALLYKHSQQLELVNADKFNPLSLAWNEDKKIFDRLCEDMIAASDLKSLMSLESLNLPGFDYNYVTHSGDSFSHIAARYDQVNILQWLHDHKGCQFDVKNNVGNDLVLVAAFNGNLATLKWLVEVRGCKLDVKDNALNDPVLQATATGQLATLQWLVEVQRCKLDVKNNAGNNPVLRAAYFGQLATLKWLVEVQGCKLDVKNNAGNNPVLLAAYGGHLATLQWLVEVQRCKLDVKNNYGNNPVLQAAYCGQLATLQWLVEVQSCKLDVKDNDGEDAVLLAACNGQLATLQWLVEVQRCKLDVKNNYGNNPVLLAALNGQLATLRWLVEVQRCKLDVKNNHGNNPVQLAALNGQLATLQWLVEVRRCNLDVKNNLGNNPVLLAAYNGQFATLQWLVEVKDCKLDVKDNDGDDAVLVAAFNGNLATLKWLVEVQRCKLDVKNNYGYNPVLLAAWNSQLATLQWLVEVKDRKLDVKNNAGNNPVLIAASAGHLATLQWLVEKKKCFFDFSRPVPLLESIKKWKPEIFAYCFSDLFDSFSANGMLNEYLAIAEGHFTRMTSQADQIKYSHLYEEKLKSDNPWSVETLKSYYRVNPISAFKFEAGQLLRENKYNDLVNLCNNYFQSDNATLREEASIVVAEQIYMNNICLDEKGSPLDYMTGENSDKLKRMIQAYYLLADYSNKAATALKDCLHVLLSGDKRVSREDVSELTWCDQAAHYFLLYMAYKQNPDSKHIQQLIEREKWLHKNSIALSSSSLFRPRTPDTASEPEAPVVLAPTHQAI